MILATLDGSIVTVALPSVRTEFCTSLSEVKWVMSIYLLVVTGLLLPFGRLADLHGQKGVYLGGLAIFTLGSVLCAGAWSTQSLIGARAAQGVGAAMLMACSPAIVTATFPPAMRGKGMGLLGLAVGVGLTAGPPLGGVLLSAFGWRSLFLINLPLGVASFVYAAVKLPRLHFGSEKESFDWGGAVFFLVACSSLLYALDSVGGSGGAAWPWFFASVVAFLLFLRRERCAVHPLVPLEIFRVRTFSAALAAGALTFLSGFVVVILTPFYLTEVRGFDPMRLGLWLTIGPLLMMAVSPWAGSLSDRIGPYRLTLAGLAIRTLSLGLFAISDAATPLPVVFAAFASLGIGNAVFMAPNTSSIMGSVPPRMFGVAGGLTAVARNLGMALGVGVGSTMFALAVAESGFAESTHDVATFLVGWRHAMWTGFVVCVLAVLVSTLRDPARPAAKG
jgi:EmrB/QacA subfamily drug resistance transporter